MGVLVDVAQVLAVLLQRARLVPALRHARVVLPLVEQAQVLGVLPVERDHGEGLAQVRDPAAVDDGAGRGLGRAHGVPRLLAPLRVLGVAGRDRGDGVLQRRERVRGQRAPAGGQRAGRLVGAPHGAGAEGRAGALPEGAPEREHDALVRRRRGRARLPRRQRVLNREQYVDQLLAQGRRVPAAELEAHRLHARAQREEHVEQQPGLRQRGRLLAVPGHGRAWRPPRAGPGAVVGGGRQLARLEIRGLGEGDAGVGERAGRRLAGGVCPFAQLVEGQVGRRRRRRCRLLDRVLGEVGVRELDDGVVGGQRRQLDHGSSHCVGFEARGTGLWNSKLAVLKSQTNWARVLVWIDKVGVCE